MLGDAEPPDCWRPYRPARDDDDVLMGCSAARWAWSRRAGAQQSARPAWGQRYPPITNGFGRDCRSRRAHSLSMSILPIQTLALSLFNASPRSRIGGMPIRATRRRSSNFI